MRSLLILLVVAMTCGCVVNKNISRNPSRYTDYSVGSIYQLKREVWIADHLGGSPYLSGNIRSAQRIEPGTRLRIDIIRFHSNPKIGRRTKIFASFFGESYPNQVALNWISKQDLHTGITLIDPEFLELVVNE